MPVSAWPAVTLAVQVEPLFESASTGLTVTAALDTGSYPTGIKISDREMRALPIIRDDFHGDWNYTLHPAPDTPEPN